jgi:hypothetical protein
MGLRIRSGNEMTIFALEFARASKTEESASGAFQSESHANWVFFDMEGIVHYEYVPENQTVNQHYYVEVLKRLRLAVCRKRPKKRQSCAWALHHDNAPAHTVHSVQAYFSKSWNSCGSTITLLP